MSILDNIAQRLGYMKAADYPRPMLSLANSERWSMPDTTSAEAQARLYSNLTSLATAVDFVAAAGAASEIEVYQRSGEGETEMVSHPYELLYATPNPAQSGYEFARDMFSYFKLTGNAYIYLNRTSESVAPAEMWVLPTKYVKPVPDGRMYIKGYVFDPGGAPQPLEPWEVLHVKTFNPFSNFVGLSPIQSLMMAGLEDIAKQKYKLNFFDKDNAVVPGALAFADMVPDSDWNRLTEDLKKQWGGGKRSGPLKLRGVGAGGVQWVQMSMSDKELDFVAGREMSRDEIWSKVAPGLASILSQNATEANAIAGKATFAEYGLWPLLTLFASKMTQNPLPAYGQNLVVRYEDPRESNRLIDLQEQAAYERVHTVAEVRHEYYGDEPLGDERDALLPAEVGKSAAPAQPSFADGQQNVTPVQTTPTAQAPEVQDMPSPAVEAELKAWQRYAVKRLGKATARDFEPREVPLWQAARIKAALIRARTEADVNVLFAGELAGGNILERALAVLERNA